MLLCCWWTLCWNKNFLRSNLGLLYISCMTSDESFNISGFLIYKMSIKISDLPPAWQPGIDLVSTQPVVGHPTNQNRHKKKNKDEFCHILIPNHLLGGCLPLYPHVVLPHSLPRPALGPPILRANCLPKLRTRAPWLASTFAIYTLFYIKTASN